MSPAEAAPRHEPRIPQAPPPPSTPSARRRPQVLRTRSDSLTRNSPTSVKRLTPSAQAAATARTGTSSMSRGTSTPPTSHGPQRPVLGRDRTGRFRPHLGFRMNLQPRTHAPQHIQRPGTGGVQPNPLHRDAASRRDRRRHQEEERGRDVSRHAPLAPPEFGAGEQAHDLGGNGGGRVRAFRVDRVHLQRRSHPGQHPLGVIAGRPRLAHAHAPLAQAESREQHGRLHLRAPGDIVEVEGPQERAAHRQRRAHPLAGVDARSHRPERADDPLHRAAA